MKWTLKTTLEITDKKRLRPGQVYSHLLQVVEILYETASPHRFHSGLHMRVVFWEEARRADKLSTVKSAFNIFMSQWTTIFDFQDSPKCLMTWHKLWKNINEYINMQTYWVRRNKLVDVAVMQGKGKIISLMNCWKCRCFALIKQQSRRVQAYLTTSTSPLSNFWAKNILSTLNKEKKI